MKVVDLLTTSKKWVKGEAAVDAKGESVSPGAKEAKKFCLVGALARCYPPSKRNSKKRKLSKTISKLFPLFDIEDFHYSDMNVVEFNDADKTTFKDIRKVLREANV